MLAFNLGGPEMMVLFVLILLLFGAKRLPQLARGIGKSLGEFQKARDEFSRELTSADAAVRGAAGPNVRPPRENRLAYRPAASTVPNASSGAASKQTDTVAPAAAGADEEAAADDGKKPDPADS